MLSIRIILLSFFLITGLLPTIYSQTNDLFTDILISDKLGDVVGLTFDHRGRMYAWKKSGEVLLLENEELLPDPLIDISEEVTTYGDHGLLGFALHPDFANNGYFYLLYVVDRHHLLHYGTPSYDPDKTVTHEATIGRITRYTADINNDFKTIIPNSRKVILGQNKTNGIPLLHISHGVGSLAFANDGTLLVSAGDGATFASADLGGFSSETYNFQALADSILKPKEDIGAFRAQLIDCLNGKILRIDPETGLGLPSNPFFDSTAPDAPRSKVWALGLRNPYRIRVKPQSGSHNPADGDPGVIFIGDVGWAYWEELNIADGAAINFGWPMYEGMKSRWQYFWEKVENKDAANPRYTIDHGCEQPFFYFKDLLLPATRAHNPFFPNPCMNTTSIPSHIPAFVHRRPVLTWSNASWNTEEQGTHIPGFDSSGNGIFYDISAANSPVKSDTFTGYCSISGVFYSGTKFPASYRNQFLGADMSGWIRKMRFDDGYQLETISPLTAQVSRIIHLEMNPIDECLYYVTYHPHFEVRKICYGGNLPPIAKVNTSIRYGTSPLTVDFDAGKSYDPEGGKINFLWDFGDGDTSSLPEPSHVFTAPDENPYSFTVQLIITDSADASDTEELIISLNNTPPTVKITSVEDEDHYPVSGSTLLPLEAEVSDVESHPEEMSYKWEIFHHHNTHVHPEPADFHSASEVLLSPEGCNGETFWYHIQLTVTDPHGLKTMDSVNIYPYCDSPYVRIEKFQVEGKEQSNLLTWEINEFKPGLSFSVQHSENLSSFRDIGNIPISNGQTQFHFEDFAPVNGLNFYRVKVSGPDKWFDYSPYRLITFPPKKPIEIFPNPFEDYVKVYFEEVFEGAFMEVFDLQGQLLFRADFDVNPSEKTYQVNTGHWISASEVYFFRIFNGEEEFVRKMVRN